MAGIVVAVLENISAAAAIAVALVTVVMMALFRKEIAGLITRIGGQPLDKTITLNQNERSIPEAPGAVDVKLESEFAREMYENFKERISSIPEDSDSKLDGVLKILANTNARLDFEIAYRKIFGSQMLALEELRRNGPGPIGEFHDVFIERVKKTWPDKLPETVKLEFENWVAFLTSPPNQYVLLKGGVATITAAGEEFLKYIAAVGAGKERPL